jgi:hypothetical protein
VVGAAPLAPGHEDDGRTGHAQDHLCQRRELVAAHRPVEQRLRHRRVVEDDDGEADGHREPCEGRGRRHGLPHPLREQGGEEGDAGSGQEREGRREREPVDGRRVDHR